MILIPATNLLFGALRGSQLTWLQAAAISAALALRKAPTALVTAIARTPITPWPTRSTRYRVRVVLWVASWHSTALLSPARRGTPNGAALTALLARPAALNQRLGRRETRAPRHDDGRLPLLSARGNDAVHTESPVDQLRRNWYSVTMTGLTTMMT